MKQKKKQILVSVAQGKQAAAGPAAGQHPGHDYTGVLISAHDPVFFRDGKPFTMGQQVHTSGIFPPYPSVIQGALRSAYFSYNPDEVPSEHSPDSTEEAEFSAPLLCRNRELLFTLPADLLPTEDELLPLKLKSRKDAGFVSRLPELTPYFLESGTHEKINATQYSFLTGLGMATYLAGEKVSARQYLNLRAENLLFEESRVGIGRTPYEVFEEGQFYRMTRVRLAEQMQFYLGIRNLSLPNKGLLTLGSEGVSGSFQKLPKPLLLPVYDLKFDRTKIYRLYVASPLITAAASPCIPDCLRETGIELLSYTMARPAAVGGWDMKLNRPKAVRYAIPAGAVFYFKISDMETFKKIRQLHGRYHGEPSYARQGFGLVMLGQYKPIP